MPYRVGRNWPQYADRCKIQFTSGNWMPMMIYQACLATGVQSNTVYIQHAVCEALARDLGVPVGDLIERLPTPRGPSKHLYDPRDGTMRRIPVMTGPANTIEDVV